MLNGHPLELYSAFLDGDALSDADAERLRAWIAEDPQHTCELIDFATVHAAITDRLMLGRLLDDLAARRTDNVVTQASLANAIREIETNSPRVEPLQLTLPPAPVETMPIAYVVAPILAVFAVAFIGLWMLLSRGPESAGPVLARQDPAARERQATESTDSPTPRNPVVAGRLVASFDARWSTEYARNPGEVLFEKSRLELLSGVVQLEMVGGAAVVLEGPAFIELIGPDAVRLEQGKAAVRVDGSSERFVVDTPTTRVIDLGTEFGVQSSPHGEAKVMVFDGVVAVAEPVAELPALSSSDEQLLANRIDAGFQTTIDPVDVLGSSTKPPEPLSNPRHFVRPDEVKVRLDALAGSIPARKLAAHYQRQRIGGLLAYQGFDAPSAGTDYVLGAGEQGLYSLAQLQFVDAADGAAGGVDVQNGPTFQMLDVSPNGPFARAGLLNESGLIGRSGKELWLRWRSRRLEGSAEHVESAGVSLMFGERSDLDEPVFFGRGFGDQGALRVETAWGRGPPPESERVTAYLDGDRAAPGVQERLVDDQEHRWVVRVEFQDGPDRVSVWLDGEVSAQDFGTPQAVLNDAEVQFDRLRMAVHRPGEIWRFNELAVAETPEALARLAKVGKFDMKSEKKRADFQANK